MVATREKLQDRQTVIFTIESGQNSSDDVWITHNLGVQHRDSVEYDYADPDMVHVEVTEDSSQQLSNSLGFLIYRPVSPNGTVRITAFIEDTNEVDVHIHANVNCVRWHSIQGDDHTS